MRAEDAAPLFAALGDETRLRLLLHLAASGPESISRLCEQSNVSRQAIAKHLDVLDRAGLARGSWIGRERLWQLNASRFADAREYLTKISKQWDDALERLRSFVEEHQD